MEESQLETIISQPIEANSLDTQIQNPGFFRRNISRINTYIKCATLVILAYAVIATAVAVKKANADTYNVPADFNTIQAAISDPSVVAGDEIIVADGTYTGNGNRDIEFLGKAITVRSENGPENCIIDCEGTVDTVEELHRGFNFRLGEDLNSVIDGFTIINGVAPVENMGLYLDTPGGAILCLESSPTISNCIISDNLAYHSMGGGMYVRTGSPTVINCRFNNNSAFNGGGLLSINSNLTIINCEFIGNSAFPENLISSGGGIFFAGTNPTVKNSYFVNNSASRGAGIFCGGYPTITNCTLTENSAENGGGVYTAYGSTSTLTNCILSDNSASEGSQIYNDGTGLSIVTYTNIQGGWPGLGNIDVDPCFVSPGYLDPNGTPANPNDDFWVEGDYHLKSEGWRWDSERERWDYDDVTSRCTDAGNPGSPLEGELLTIPGDPNNEWGVNKRINMGAYGGTEEASMPPYDWALLADLTNKGIVNLEDFAAQAQYWLIIAGEQPGDLDRNGTVYLPDLALLMEDYLKQTVWYEQ